MYKLRGSKYLEGAHAFRITGSGLDIYPRLVSPRIPEGYEPADERLSTADEPTHDDLCEREQRYLLKAIDENLDLTDHMNDGVKSLKIVLAAERSIYEGQVVSL